MWRRRATATVSSAGAACGARSAPYGRGARDGQDEGLRAEACGDARSAGEHRARPPTEDEGDAARGTVCGRVRLDRAGQEAAEVDDAPPEDFDGDAGTELFEPERESVR